MGVPEPKTKKGAPRLRTHLIAVAIVIIIATALVYYFTRQTEGGQSSAAGDSGIGSAEGARVGARAPDFVVESLDGKQIRLSDLQGKAVWLSFWATWCPPCRAEMPDIEAIYEQKKDSGLVVLAVSIGEDQSTVQRFVEANGYTFSVGVDPQQVLGVKYRVIGTPTHYFIDKSGVIRDVRSGELSRAQMLQRIAKILG